MTKYPNIFELWDAKPETGPTPSGTYVHVEPERASAYATAALRSECENVAGTPNGHRNDELNKAAFRMGRHVGAGSIDAATVREALANAARATGLPEDEIQTVLRGQGGGVDAGAEVPRHPTPQDPIPAVTVLPNDISLEILSSTDDNPGPPLNPIIDWHELFATDDDGEEWIIEPLLPARRMIALYSAPKAGKSLLMLEIAVGIARGTEVLGVTPDRPRNVLYVDFENDPRGDIRSRLEAMDVGPDQLDGLRYLTFPSLAKFDTAQGALDLMRHVAHYEAEVVVIDTVSRAVMGEENENDTWLNFYRHTGLALKRAEVACIRLDHSGKDAEKGMRGGSAKSGDVDAVWRLTLLNETTIQLECTDHRMPVPAKFLTLTRQDYPLAHVPAGDAWQTASDAKTQAVDDLLEQLSVPCSASVKDAGKALREAGHRAENRALSNAVKSRKMRLDLDTPDPLQSVPRNAPERSGTPGGTFRGTPPPLGGVRNAPGSVPAHERNATVSDPDELVSCKRCFRPTSADVAGKNAGLCQHCADHPEETPDDQ